eukprot:4193810-Amphidinium_carterae.1
MHDSADMQVLQAQEALAKQANPPKLGFDNALVVSPLDESLEVSTSRYTHDKPQFIKAQGQEKRHLLSSESKDWTPERSHRKTPCSSSTSG